MRNRRLVRIRPGGARLTLQPFWPTVQGCCGMISKSLGRLHDKMLGPHAVETRP